MPKNDSRIDKYNDIVDLYHKESDRGAAVLAASFLDVSLEKCIRTLLVDDPVVDELFKGYNPLSSFAARIDMAFALGLIDSEMKDDCKYVKKIRNHFAHHPDETSFDVVPVKDFCANLSTARLGQTEPRLQYLLAIGKIVIALDAIIRNQQKWPKPIKYVLWATDDSTDKRKS